MVDEILVHEGNILARFPVLRRAFLRLECNGGLQDDVKIGSITPEDGSRIGLLLLESICEIAAYYDKSRSYDILYILIKYQYLD